MNPSDPKVSCYVDHCPICGKPGRGHWYKLTDLNEEQERDGPHYFEFIVNHSTGNQTQDRQKDSSRNRFHHTGFTRQADDDEIEPSWRASPKYPPDWPAIKKALRKGQTTLD